MEEKLPELLQPFVPVVRGLGSTLGKNFELILYQIEGDFSETRIAAIKNGEVTDRNVGDRAPELLIDMLKSIKDEEDMILNYVTKTREGKPLKSSTFIIRDDNNKIRGAFCINIDMTHIKIAQNFLNDLADIGDEESLRDKFPEDVEDMLQIVIKNGLEVVDKPVHLLNKKDKLKIVEYLDENNAFNIKDTVNKLAQELNVSRYTIYNYIDEVRSAK